MEQIEEERFRLDDVTRIRLVLDSGIVHEMPLTAVDEYVEQRTDEMYKHLRALANAIRYFSCKGASPEAELVVEG